MRELTGYSGTNWRTTTDVYVLDRWYCHEVVASFRAHGFQENGPSLLERRLQAQAVARRFEYEHRTWLREAS